MTLREEIGPISHANDMPSITARELERLEIERLTEKYLAAGGTIKAAAQRSLSPIPWAHTENQARRHLASMGTIATIMNVSPLRMETICLENGFPQAYMWKGEIHFAIAACKQWSLRNKRLLRNEDVK